MKTLNKRFVELIHHKINSLTTCLELMEPGCFMGSIDISNAFHTIPMHQEFTKYLKFKVGDTVYRYLVLPMGFRDSPRLFCKILKPVLAFLRNQNLLSSVYIDDFFLLGPSFMKCKHNVQITYNTLRALGFEISEKSVLEPKQQMLHLGFILNSINMTVSLGEEKQKHIISLAVGLLEKTCISVRLLSRFIGTIVASFPAVDYGQLFYRHLEFQKIESLRLKYDYEQLIELNTDSRGEVNWWIEEGVLRGNVISRGNPDHIMQTDSSGFAWGAKLNSVSTQGYWDTDERKLHINIKEMKAAYLGVLALCSHLYNCHLQIQIDNQTAVAYINNMGGTHCKITNELARKLITWGKFQGVWISACHIAGKDNPADVLSRKLNPNTEWMLDGDCFRELCEKFGEPHIDLFASRINHQLPIYMSFHPDAQAHAIDAFAHSWESYVYIFPPFILISRILQKIREDKTPKVLMIVPDWSVAPWFQ